MVYQIRQPVVPLRPYIRHLAVSYAEIAKSYNVLPDTALVVGFQFSGSLSHIVENIEQALDNSGITGLLDRYRIFKNKAGTGSVLIVFTETGASNFLKVPLHELFGKSLSLEHFFSSAAIQETREMLEAARDDNERLTVVENFLLRQFRERKCDQLVAGALHYIHHSKGTIRMAALAELLHTSQSPLEKRFRAVVGASPKKFAGIVRARQVMDALTNNSQNLAEHLLSYYDQAHFIKDFKRFSSMTPEHYLKNIRRVGK